MPKISEIVDSDDDYQDAISVESVKNSATTTPSVPKLGSEPSNPEIVDEIIRQQTKLNPRNEPDNENNFASSSCSSDVKLEEDPISEYVCEEINEDELTEKEKSMTVEELEANKEKADKMKLEANELFKNNQAGEAVDIYTEALKICPMNAKKERAVLYGNRAAAKIKLESKKSALDDCTKALDLWPDYVRVLLRRAKLYEHDDKLDEALADYKRVYELDHGQSEAREALVRLPPVIEERNERLKEEMLNKLKELGNMVLKPFGLSTSNFKMQKDPNTGSYTINFQNS